MTTPKWLDRISNNLRPEAVKIHNTYRKAVSEADRTFTTASVELRRTRTKAITSAGDEYREAKKALKNRDR